MKAARVFLLAAGLGGALSVTAGAMAQHVLAGDAYRFQLASTSARYGLIHALALLALAALLDRMEGRFWLRIGGWLFVAGLVLFCGSLDLVALGASHGWEVLTPWGGSAFILGWLAILVAALRARPAA